MREGAVQVGPKGLHLLLRACGPFGQMKRINDSLSLLRI